MTPTLKIPPDPAKWEAALSGLVAVNRLDIRAGRLPRLYGSGVRYQAEHNKEEWRPASEVVAHGCGDCEDLAAWRAAEYLELGAAAVLPSEGSADLARQLAPKSMQARVVLYKTAPALYHAVAEYELGGKVFRDDPSARLGMHAGAIDHTVRRLEGAAISGAGMRAIKVSGMAPGNDWAEGVSTRDGLLHVTPASGHRVMVDQVSPGVYVVGVVVDDEEIAGVGAVLATSALAATALKALLKRAGAKVIERNANGEGVIADVRERLAQRRAEQGGEGGGGTRERAEDWRENREGKRVFRLPLPVRVGCDACKH